MLKIAIASLFVKNTNHPAARQCHVRSSEFHLIPQISVRTEHLFS